jgi:hypothetical protein
MVALVSKDSSGPDRIGNNWVDRSLKRHPEVHTKIGVKIDAQRLRNITPEALETFDIDSFLGFASSLAVARKGTGSCAGRPNNARWNGVD